MSSKIIVKADPDLQDLIPSYLEKRKAEISVLREAFSQKDYMTLKNIAHKIKGNAGGYGFDLLGDLGGQLEQASINQNDTDIQDVLNKIAAYLTNVEVVYT